MLWLIILILLILIILIALFIYFLARRRTVNTSPAIDLTKLRNIDDLIPCSGTTDQFLVSNLGPNGDLNAILTSQPTVATVACFNAITEANFSECESIVVPNDNLTFAQPVAYRTIGNEVQLYYISNIADSC